MGRPLFSLSHNSEPAVRQQPEQIPYPYEKWSPWNRFDPDSDEFFQDPVHEVFIEPTLAEDRVEMAAAQAGEQEDPILVEMREMTEDSSSSSSEGSVSEEGSPMAVGSDDPISLLSQAYGTRRRQELRTASAQASHVPPRVPLPRMIRREEPRYIHTIPEPTTRITPLPRLESYTSDMSGVTQAFGHMSATALPRLPPIVAVPSVVDPPAPSFAPTTTTTPIPIPITRGSNTTSGGGGGSHSWDWSVFRGPDSPRSYNTIRHADSPWIRIPDIRA